MNREIKASEAVMRARKTVFTGLSQYRIPYSRELEGKYFKLVFDNGTIVILTFPARNAVEIQINDEKRLSEDAYVQKAEEGAYLVMTEIAGSSPRTAYMFVIEDKATKTKILHTGDFRRHGYLGKGLFPTLRKFVGNVDILITEGTMLGRKQEKVEVSFLERKGVKKPGGARPGFVIYHSNYSITARTDLNGLTEITD